MYQEFHEQGDVEKALGWKPIPLFDRENAEQIASMQVIVIGVGRMNSIRWHIRLDSSAASACPAT